MIDINLQFTIILKQSSVDVIRHIRLRGIGSATDPKSSAASDDRFAGSPSNKHRVVGQSGAEIDGESHAELPSDLAYITSRVSQVPRR